MRLKVPGLTLIAPLHPRPIRDGILGALTGLILGVIAIASSGHPPTTPDRAELGFLLGGAVLGVIVGTCLPLMKHRWVAGLVVVAATACACAVAFPLWNEAMPIPMYLFFGVCAGITYSALLWEYRPESEVAIRTQSDDKRDLS